MAMKIVKLPDGTYINPQYVVRIEAHRLNPSDEYRKTFIWTADGGCATVFNGDRRDEMAALIFPEVK